jgi:hypothetical protein
MRYLYLIFRDLFITSLVFLFALLFIEDLRPNFISAWLDLKVVFYLVLGVGLLTILTSQNKEKMIK